MSIELKPDTNGFRYVLLWLNYHIEHKQDADQSYLIEWADFVRDARDEIERLQARLEVDPRHNYDGIDSRDVTIRLQDELIDALETEGGRMQKICAAAYQMAGVVNAPVRFLDVLSRPYEATQEQIDALLPVREDEFEEIAALRKDAERFEWIEENAMTEGGGQGFTIFVPVDHEDIGCGIDTARATQP